MARVGAGHGLLASLDRGAARAHLVDLVDLPTLGSSASITAKSPDRDPITGQPLAPAPSLRATGVLLAAPLSTAGSSGFATDTTETRVSAAAIDPLATYIVLFDDTNAADQANTAARVNAVLRSLGDREPLQALEVYGALGGFSIQLTARQAQRLANIPTINVKSVEADAEVQGLRPVEQNALSPYANTTTVGETVPWGVQAVWQGKAPTTDVGQGRYAFVIDTGVSDNTGDLTVDSSLSKSWVTTASSAADDNGHGTHVAGTIAALAGNSKGVVGVAAGATVVSLKVLDSTGSGSLANVVSAVNDALLKAQKLQTDGLISNLNSVVVNLSLGAKGSYSSLETAIRTAARAGLRFAIAAGNNGSDADGFTPANTGDEPNVYTVSAVDSAYKMTNWSNWDKPTATDKIDDVDWAAPGQSVVSLGMSGGLVSMSGTSMASPHVAGLLLAGGLDSGGLVTPYYAGTADPFATTATLVG